jgi:hypothetical protein
VPRRTRDGMRAVGGLALAAPDLPAPPAFGPYDEDDLDAELTDALGRVDFGAVRVPVPRSGSVTVEPAGSGRLQAVHVTLPEGRLSVSALAAPRSGRLWPELAGEIDASLRQGGARVRSYQGEWGRELHARTEGATSVFVGVDGPRWMLYGVATGPTCYAGALEAELRRMLKGAVVVRGRSPYPVRTVLPLTLPEHLRQGAEAAERAPHDEAALHEEAARVAALRDRVPAPRADEPASPADDDAPTEQWPAPPGPGRHRSGAGPGPGRPVRAPGHRPSAGSATEAISDPPTQPLPLVVATEPDRRGRHAHPEGRDDAVTDVMPAVPAPSSGTERPALAFLAADPMALFAPAPTGRHHRPE